MSFIEIDDLVNFGTKSIKDVRTRRIYNEEPGFNGLLLESIRSNLTLNSEADFTTSVTGNIIVGASGSYEADLDSFWDVNAGTSGCIHVVSEFCLDIGSTYNVTADILSMNFNSYAEIHTGTSFSVSTQDFFVKDLNNSNCFIIDTNSCGVTVNGTLTSQTIQIGEGGLDVLGNVDVSGNLTLCNGNISLSSGSDLNPSFTFCNDMDTGLFNPGTNKLGFSTNGTLQVLIDSAGQVGIGTNNPSSLLHVYDGNMIVTNTSSTAFIIEDDSGNDCITIDTSTFTTNINGSVQIVNNLTSGFYVQKTDNDIIFNINTLNDEIGVSSDLNVTQISHTAFTVGSGVTDCFIVDTTDCTVNVHGKLEVSSLGISGDLVVNGNLTVHGSETILNTETVNVDDHAITLNGITSPTDITANQGGIVLKGDIDYTILWDKDCANGSWSFNQNINVNDTLGYYIDCKLYHSKENLVVNTRSNTNSGAIYLSTNDYTSPLLGDWRIKTQTNIYGYQVLVFQYHDGSSWVTKQRIESS